MRTELPDELLATDQGREANEILRSCVQCGFCTATCPTYQELGNELDGPRGRIWLIKELLERGEAGVTTQRHLDRCLSCRACETTCPSGVRYGRLLELGREQLEQQVPRAVPDRLQRWLLLAVVPWRRRLRPLLRLGQWLRPLLPTGLRARVPRRQQPLVTTDGVQASADAAAEKRVILPRGCVQELATPETRAAAIRVLARRGIQVVEAGPQEGCCGALPLHLNAGAQARLMARRNIDSWWPLLQAGASQVVATASGCGLQLKEYPALLHDDPDYAQRAETLASRVVDLSELLQADAPRAPAPQAPRVAWQSPCTLQHGQQVRGRVEALLAGYGVKVVPAAEAHLCCGSAGSYSLLQPELAERLRARKLKALGVEDDRPPDIILTANVGCQLHLAAGTTVPVRHWIEYLDLVDRTGSLSLQGSPSA